MNTITAALRPIPEEIQNPQPGDYIHKNRLFPGLTWTDGVEDLCEACQSHWMKDLIFSHQTSRKVQREEFQKWEFRHTPTQVQKSRFNAICTDGNGNEIVRQVIPFSDFPYSTATFWLVNRTLILPSEY